MQNRFLYQNEDVHHLSDYRNIMFTLVSCHHKISHDVYFAVYNLPVTIFIYEHTILCSQNNVVGAMKWFVAILLLPNARGFLSIAVLLKLL